jgi:cytochrome P450
MTNRLTGMRAATTLLDLGSSSIAAGVIARRKPVVRLLERAQADSRAVMRMQALRREFGSGPVELVLPGRRTIVVLDPEDVGRVLAQAPTPFHPASPEKRQALQWFQPHGVLISQGPIRQQRRELNEATLDTGAEVHRQADAFAAVVAEEVRDLATAAVAQGHLTSSQFMTTWWRIVRRVVLGDRARDDALVTDALMRLRKAGNWSFLSLSHYRARSKFLDGLYRYVEDPEPGSLASVVAQTPSSGAVDPVGQMPQWIFAFDAAGMALLRAMAVLATHPAERSRALEDAVEPERLSVRPYLRGCVQESVRLWPTTPTILRTTTEDTVWSDGSTIAKGAGLMIVAPAFHRDDDVLPFAHAFAPHIWTDGTAQRYPQLVPFSAGPAECPGRNLVLFVTSTLLSHLLNAVDIELISTPKPLPDKPLPMTLNQLTLDFDVRPVSQPVSSSAPR